VGPDVHVAVERFLFVFTSQLEQEYRKPGPVNGLFNPGLKPPSPGHDPIFFGFAQETGV
jgi:hypothetical protein